jgi:DNA polymerase-3 subunit beta
MKITVLQENLLPKISTAARVASARSTLPILENLLLCAERGKLTVSATDLETGVTASCGAKVEKEGSLTVPAKILVGVVNNLPPGKINLTVEKDILHIEAQGVKSQINGISADDFPEFKLEGKKLFSVKSSDLKGAVSQVSFATAQDESRPILTGILFKFSGGELTLTGVDGFRLSEKKIKVVGEASQDAEGLSLVIPARGLGEVGRLVGKGEVEISSPEPNQLLFKTEEFSLFTQALEGEFPEYEQIIPVNFETKVGFVREELNKAVQLTSVFSDKGASIITLSFDLAKKAMQVGSQESELGEVRSEVDIKGEGKTGKIAFNSRYLADALASFNGEDLELSLNSALDPVLFKDPKDENYTHVVMPVRIQE